MNRLTAVTVALAPAAVATLGLLACNDLSAPTARASVDSLVVVNTGIADGVSLIPVRAVVDTALLPPSQRVVIINTTLGTFVLGGKQSVSLTPDAIGRAITYLQAPRDSGVALVSATAGTTAGGVSVTDTVVYRRAPIASIVVVPDSFSISAGINHFTKVTARLLRAVGYPSPRAIVVFSAADTLSTPRGQFSATLPSDTTEQVVVMFTPARSTADTLYRGPLFLTAVDSTNPTVIGRATIIVR